jgi:hypothetical protein
MTPGPSSGHILRISRFSIFPVVLIFGILIGFIVWSFFFVSHGVTSFLNPLAGLDL